MDLPTDPIFRGMTRVELDVAYNNVKAEPDFTGLMTRYRDSSRALYEAFQVERDISYGPGPRQRFDWVSCGRPTAPTFVFIHGGYWQNYTKEDLAFVARGPLARGFNVALAEYTLAPQASMTQIVGEIDSLLNHLVASDSPAGFGGRPVCLCGHSAGGQLAALHRSHPAVDVAVAVSGLFDLEPIALSWLNDKLQLTPTEIGVCSPLRHIVRGSRTIVSVGSAELTELVRHSTEYTEACRAKGEAATYLSLAGRTHFTILQDLAMPNSAILGAILEAVGSVCASVESPGRTPTRHRAVDNTGNVRNEKS
jgi:acetyl esterase/lipase